MRTSQRKSAPEVTGGRVQKKNNWEISPNYYDTPQVMPVIDRKRPGKGYRHILKKRDIYDFIGILPDWPELSRGLNAVVLAPGDFSLYGYHVPGVVHVCAWAENLWIECEPFYYERDQAILERLGVPCLPTNNNIYICRFNESTARAFQLLEILLHELGHHHDRITTRSQRRASRGEPYAEEYARRYQAQIWDDYQRRFELY